MKKNKYKSEWKLDRPWGYNHDKTDNKKAYKKECKQLENYGFGDSETWNLDSVFSEFVLPRLKRFRDIISDGHKGIPGMIIPDGYHKLSEEEQDKESEKLIKKWFKIVDEMIEGFELHSTHFEWEHKEGKEKKWKKVNRGLKHFSKYYLCLWW